MCNNYGLRRITEFDSETIPSNSMEDYVKRIAKYSLCSDSCFALALIYINRLIRMNPHLAISPYNMHRIFVTAMLVSTKYHEDKYFNNAYWAKIAGVSLYEMNRLELKVLFLLDFNLFVSSEEYAQFRDLIRKDVVSAKSIELVDITL